MDLSNFKVSDWLMVGGGAAMLVLGFVLPWTTIPGDSGDNPFDYFLTGGIAWILIVAVGVLAFLRASERLPEQQPWALIFLLATALATLLMIIRVIIGGRDVLFIEGGRGVGMYGALIWSAIALAGAFMEFQAGGGDIKDLTNMDKMKQSFSGGDDPGETPPPPPPAPPASGS